MIGYRCKRSNAFSRVILISQLAFTYIFILCAIQTLSSAENLANQRVSGDGCQETFQASNLPAFQLFRAVSDGGYSSEVTPVPIPNTEVKLACADGTARATVWESRSPPSPTALFFICPPKTQKSPKNRPPRTLNVPRMGTRIERMKRMKIDLEVEIVVCGNMILSAL